jgi:hypothetical protein
MSMRTKSSRDSIEVACPRCGAQQTMRISRLNDTRTCVRCNTSFCINDQGRYVIEEATPATWLRRRGAALTKQFHLKRIGKLWMTRTNDAQAALFAPWLRLPRRWRMVISTVSGSGLAALLACWIFTTWSMRDDPSRENAESLSVRAELACQALLVGDDAVLVGLATRDSQDDARRWLWRVRPPHWPQSGELAKTAQVDLSTLFKSLKTQRAAVYFTIRTQFNLNRAPDVAPDMEGTLCWTLGHDGRWQLDGRRTLDELASARRTD